MVYVQLLMIGQVIRAKNVNQNAKKQKRPPKSSKNKMFISGLCSTSDDQLSDPSGEQWLKCKKRPPKSAKIEMFIISWSTRRPPEDCQKTFRRLPEDHQKTVRRPPEGLWLSSGSLLTLWYKEISIKDYTFTWTAVPWALWLPCLWNTLKENICFSNSAGILGQHDIVLLADVPPLEKLDFVQVATFPIFSHQSGSKWLRMANFSQFATFLIFSHRSG